MAGCGPRVPSKTQQFPPFPELKSFQIPFGNTINDGELFENGLNPLKLLRFKFTKSPPQHEQFQNSIYCGFFQISMGIVGKVKVTKF
jgi:hypothetical protein